MFGRELVKTLEISLRANIYDTTENTMDALPTDEFTPYKIKPSQYSEIVDKYNGHHLVTDIAVDYGVNIYTIYRILNKCNVVLDTQGRKGKLSEERQQEIADKYERGSTAAELATEYETSSHTVSKILKDKNVDARKPGPKKGNNYSFYRFQRKVASEDHTKIAARYKDGINTPELSKEFDISRERICKILDKMGVERRNSTLTEKEWREIIRLYVEEKHPIKKISSLTGRSISTILGILKNNSIPIESGRGKTKVQKEAYVAIVQRYKNGEKLKSIGQTYGVKDSTIGYILKKLGVKKDRAKEDVKIKA